MSVLRDVTGTDATSTTRVFSIPAITAAITAERSVIVIPRVPVRHAEIRSTEIVVFWILDRLIRSRRRIPFVLTGIKEVVSEFLSGDNSGTDGQSTCKTASDSGTHAAADVRRYTGTRVPR